MSFDIFEVQVSDGRRWGLVQKYAGSERQAAIAHANSLFATQTYQTVRVVRETFDQASQVFKHQTILRLAKPVDPTKRKAVEAKPPPARRVAPRPAKPAPAPTASQAPDSGDAAAPHQEAVASAPEPVPPAIPQPPAMDRLTKRALLATAVGLPVAGGGLLLLTSQAASTAIGAMFTGQSLFVTAPMLLAGIGYSLYQYDRTQRSKARASEAEAAAAAESAAASGAPSGPESGAQSGTQSGEAPPPVLAAATPAAGADRGRAPTAASGSSAAPSLPGVALPGVAGQAPAPAAPGGQSAQPAAEQDERAALLRFFHDCLAQEAARPFVAGKLNGHNRFGLHLFLLGAGEAAIGANGSSDAPLDAVLQPALALLGSDAGRVRSFLARREDYAGQERYGAMIEAGRQAMIRFAGATGHAGSGLDGSELAAALEEWNQGHAVDAWSDVVAIMFTDMIASVSASQALGDEGMLKLVQAHNLIVGAVLRTHRGHQVKHTGDGIMAVFPNIADGVAAGGEIQRQIAEHNRVTMGHKLVVRIGVACGQPIRDQDDYFGTVVQLAARLCAMAGEAEVCVSQDVVAAVPADEGFRFTEARAVALKGFREAQQVCRLRWDDAASGDAEAAADEAAGQPLGMLEPPEARGAAGPATPSGASAPGSSRPAAA